MFVINIVTGLGLGPRDRLQPVRDLQVPRGARRRRADRRRRAQHARLDRADDPLQRAHGGGRAWPRSAVFPQRFLYSIGVGGAVVALTSVLVSLTVLPAMLAMLGPRVNALAPRRLQSPPSEQRWTGSGASCCATRRDRDAGDGGDGLISLPFLRVELTRADASVLPSGQQRLAGRLRSSTKRFAGDPASRDRHRADRAARRPARIARPRAGADRGCRRRRAPVRARRRAAGRRAAGVDPSPTRPSTRWRWRATFDWGGSLVDGPPAELTDQRDSLADHLPRRWRSSCSPPWCCCS